VLKRSDMILGLMHDTGVLSGEEYRTALAEVPNISGMQRKVDQSLSAKVQRFFKNVFKLFP
jgi:monofunctional glycosyltransferase